MNPYERRSILLFSALYTGGILLLYSLVGFWYYQKETRRINAEERVALSLYESRCARLTKLDPTGKPCAIETPDFSASKALLRRELTIASLITLVLGGALSVALALAVLRPIRRNYRMMDAFIHAMIHDLGTPISAARINIDALADTALSPQQLKRVGRITRALQRLSALQDQMRLALVRSEAAYSDSEFDLCVLLHELREFSELIDCTCKHALTIRADRTMIERMIENLPSNAVKYNRDNRRITLRLEEHTLIIQDHGIGIRRPDRVFERYYREASSMSGMGLGLGIVQMICRHYNLPLHLESRLREGTTVRIDFRPITLHYSSLKEPHA
ncbi:MAG: HAMP domain-containing histidine kinase [Campylobacterales bacterium]|nr:HAMP domain-containing histidine kinase [Campylobacterales bacterium]